MSTNKHPYLTLPSPLQGLEAATLCFGVFLLRSFFGSTALYSEQVTLFIPRPSPTAQAAGTPHGTPGTPVFRRHDQGGPRAELGAWMRGWGGGH